MTKRVLLIVLLYTLSNSVIAQTIVFNKAFQVISSYPALSFSVQNAPSGYLLYGLTVDSASDQDATLVKIDSLGNILWQQMYNKPGFIFVPYSTVNELGIVIPWGGEIGVVDWENDTSSSLSDWSLYRFDENGDTLWTKNYHDSAGVELNQVKITREKKYLIYGQWYDFIDIYNVPMTLFLTKADTLGNRIWTKTYHADSGHEQFPSGIDTCLDGGYVLCAYDFDTTGNQAGAFCQDGSVFVMKTDSAGNIKWKTYIPDTLCNVQAFSVKALKHGGYMVCGYWDDSLAWNGTPYSIMYMAKLNDSGNMVWHKTYGVHSSGEASIMLYNLKEVPNGDLVICGSGLVNDSSGNGGAILKTDSNGNQIWYELYEKFISSVWDYLTDIQLTSDGGFISSGYTYGNPEEIWVVKTDSLGCDSGCNEVTGTNKLIAKGEELRVYPNPNNGIFTVALSHAELVSPNRSLWEASQPIIEVYNVLGEKVYNATLKQVQGDEQINISSQPNGIYLYRVTTKNGNLVGEGKLIIQK